MQPSESRSSRLANKTALHTLIFPRSFVPPLSPVCPLSELHRCAVFCLLQLGGEIFDTDMVIVDRTLTDICFDNTIVL